MQDFVVAKNADGIYDLVLDNYDFENVDSFETSILVSFRTDSRASDSQILEASKRRGWVGDILTSNVGRSLGSTLWVYDQPRNDQVTRNEITEAANNCLQWMVEDNIARSVVVTIRSYDAVSITFLIKISTDTGDKQYSVLWSLFDGNKIT